MLDRTEENIFPPCFHLTRCSGGKGMTDFETDKETDDGVYLCEHVRCHCHIILNVEASEWCVLQQFPSHSKDWEIINGHGMSFVFAWEADILA